MERHQATKFLRELLDQHGLKEWHVRLTNDLTRPFLGLCSHKDKCIILNAHHIDTHPDIEVENTIRHEVAHALTPGHGHDGVWSNKAKELGCDSISPCANFGFDARAIDAIRSGADVEVSFDTEVVRRMSYKISKLQDKCPTCGKIAITRSTNEFETPQGRKKATVLECFHVIITDADSKSPFEKITFDGDPKCKHVWDKTVCIKCNAKRLYPFQIEGARSLEKANGRFAILDEMGLGKTIQALAYLSFDRPNRHPFLWVTKAGTLFQHAKEIWRVLGPEAFPQVVRSGKDRLFPGFNYIASYDIFRHIAGKGNLDMFEKAGIKTLILDEVQAIKNVDSSRTKYVRRIARNIGGIIPLSGTPWKNRGSELFVMLNLLDPKLFDSFEKFKLQDVDYYYDRAGKVKEGGIRNPARFREKISHIAVRRERTEVLPELPLVNRTRILCEIPEYARKTYKETEDKLIDIYNNAVIGGEENSFETQGSILQQLVILRQITGIAKVPRTVEHAKEFLEETDRKLVIFVHHVKCGEMVLEQLKSWCAVENLPEPLALSANMNAAERMDVAEKFNGPDYRVLVASTLASGEGLNLQTCSDCIMHERQWNPANEEQAEGRFVRIGQKADSVNAIYVHADDSVDTDLDEIVSRKRVQFHAAMNKGEMPVWNEAGMISELVEKIAGKRRR